MADPNTRQGKRTPVTLKIKFKSETLEQFIERYAVDVSQGGIFIRTKEPLAVGTQMRFEFQLRDASPLIAGEGTVVWTRENDPSRPAIAPGMGVRFDRLAEGSQAILERILSEKAKQAPSRGAETTKPPMFTDTPTRVAPAPVQDALLGNDRRRDGRSEFGDHHTPLPKPTPFHSDADEFPDEAFEEATKVRALDDLIAQTAGDSGSTGPGENLFSGKPPDELAARRSTPRADSTLADPPSPVAPQHLEPSSTSPGFASARNQQTPERDSAPGLPSPPEAHKPRLLDTSPSPRTEDAGAAAAAAKEALIAQNARMEKLAKTRIGMEPAHVATRTASPTSPSFIRDAPTRPSGIKAMDTPVPSSRPMAPEATGSKAPLIILLLVLLATAGAGVWFFVLREKAVEGTGSGSVAANPPGSNGLNKLGSDKVVENGSNGSADDGSGSNKVVPPPKGPMVDIEITAPFPKAKVEVVDGDSGLAPLKTKLEKDKTYKIRVSAPGFATLEQEIKGGLDKYVSKLDPKPYVITVSSTPSGALILMDGQPIGHSTPFDVELTKVQIARKNVRVGLRRNGFRPIDKVVDTGMFKEDPAKMLSQVDERLAVMVVIQQPPRPPTGSGSATPTGSGSATPAGSGSATPPTGSGTPDPTGGSGGGGNGVGSAKEPEPNFIKPPTP